MKQEMSLEEKAVMLGIDPKLDPLAIEAANYIHGLQGRLCNARDVTKAIDAPPHKLDWPAREAITRAVLSGAPICSNPKGFYWGSPAQAADTSKRLLKRALKVLKRADALARYAEQHLKVAA